MSTRDDVVDFYERYIRACNTHDFDRLSEFVAEDVNGPGEGLSAYIRGLKGVVEAFPDYVWVVEEIIVEGARLAVRLTGSGTHQRAFLGVAATGRRIRTQELVIYHVVAGRISRCWGDLGTTVRDAIVSGPIPA